MSCSNKTERHLIDSFLAERVPFCFGGQEKPEVFEEYRCCVSRSDYIVENDGSTVQRDLNDLLSVEDPI